MKLIYVAGPYRGPTKEAVELNIQAAKHVGLLVARLGHSPIIPHMNTALMDFIDPTLGDQFWLDATMAIMRRCNAVVLVAGARESIGTQAEIAEARRLIIPVFECVEGLEAWFKVPLLSMERV